LLEKSRSKDTAQSKLKLLRHIGRRKDKCLVKKAMMLGMLEGDQPRGRPRCLMYTQRLSNWHGTGRSEESTGLNSLGRL